MQQSKEEWHQACTASTFAWPLRKSCVPKRWALLTCAKQPKDKAEKRGSCPMHTNILRSTSRKCAKASLAEISAHGCSPTLNLAKNLCQSMWTGHISGRAVQQQTLRNALPPCRFFLDFNLRQTVFSNPDSAQTLRWAGHEQKPRLPQG